MIHITQKRERQFRYLSRKKCQQNQCLCLFRRKQIPNFNNKSTHKHKKQKHIIVFVVMWFMLHIKSILATHFSFIRSHIQFRYFGLDDNAFYVTLNRIKNPSLLNRLFSIVHTVNMYINTDPNRITYAWYFDRYVFVVWFYSYFLWK